MRPVERGAASIEALTYESMSPTLRARIGEYCSYCEFPVDHVPHTEHIVPKDRFPAWRDRWENLVVSCTWCNSHKGNELPRPQDLADYLWPTTDNTARAFTYGNVIPEVDRALPEAMQLKAARLRGCVKLGIADELRAQRRAEVFTKAQHYRDRMQTASDAALVRDMMVNLALKSGFFSVWMEVFASDVAMRRRLIDAFVGTSKECFDEATTQPIARPGGRV